MAHEAGRRAEGSAVSRSGGTAVGPAPLGTRGKRRLLGVFSAFSLIGLAGVAAVRHRLLIVEVAGRSMEPAYRTGDRLLVRRGGGFRVGRAVLVRKPPGWPGREAGGHLVKRVAAMPGEEIPEPFLRVLAAAPGDRVPAGSLLLHGDAPAHSIDSRQLGHFPTADVVGPVLLRLGRGSGTADPRAAVPNPATSDQEP